MGDPFLIAVIALGLSLGVSAIRLVDWFIHSDPKAILRIARLAPTAFAVLSVVLLVVLMLNRQWTAAIGLMAFMVLLLAWYLPRLLRRPFKLVDLAPADAAQVAAGGAPDRELVERSIAVLESYLLHAAAPAAQRRGHVQPINGKSGNVHSHINGHDQASEGGAMSAQEAREVLGLEPSARAAEINDAHRRLVQLLHPDRGGSHYLTIKINEARAVLLGATDRRSRSTGAGEAGKAKRRRPQPRRHPQA
jgi:hypothetical protein